MTKPRRKLPHQIPADAVKRAYFAELLGMVNWCRSYIQKHLVPSLDELAARHSQRTDAPDSPSTINGIVKEAKRAFSDKFPQWHVQKLLEGYAKRASDHQRVQLHKQVKEVVGVTLGSVIDKGLNKAVDSFTASNVALITTIPERYFSDIEQVALNGLREGKRAEELAEDFEDRYGVAKDRAYLIARDQIGKFTGDLNRTRQTNIGVEKFIWRGMNDERERDWHTEREGEVFTWAEGVPEDDQEDGAGDAAFPGMAINCRCYPEPVLDDLEDD